MNRALLTAVACLVAGSASSAYADTVLYSTGFENPPFTPGPVAGQDGWAAYGNSSASQIEDTVADSGSQALAVIPALGAGQTGAYYGLTTSDSLIEITADLMIDSSTNQSEWQFAGMGPGLFPFVGGFDVTSTGQIDLMTAGKPDVGTLTYNTWNLVDLLFNFTTQTYNLSINGTVLASNAAFCGDNTVCAGAPVSSFGNFIFDAFPASSANDIGFIDNLTISTPSGSTTPEPGSLMLLGSGLLLLAARRWRSVFARNNV